jgi:hypothetical protein
MGISTVEQFLGGLTFASSIMNKLESHTQNMQFRGHSKIKQRLSNAATHRVSDTITFKILGRESRSRRHSLLVLESERQRCVDIELIPNRLLNIVNIGL